MLVSTTSFRPVWRAVWARTWMVRLTPLTSAKVSVIQALLSLARRRWAAAGNGRQSPCGTARLYAAC